MSLARWVNGKLIHTDQQGKAWPPGGGQIARWKQPDETEVSIASSGDELDLYIGREQIYNVTLTPKVARQLARWILRWWAWSCWYGLKAWLWEWSQRRMLDEKRDQEAARATQTSPSVGGPPWQH